MSTLPFVDLKSQYARIKPLVDARIQAVLDHGQFIMGPEIAEVETRLAEFADARHCVTVSSGTDALLALLLALDIGPGDAVFLPTFTFTASAEVVALIGSSPVFVDVDPLTCNIAPADLQRQIAWVRDEGRFTPRLVMAVDLFGLPADYAALAQICQDETIGLIADAAQSFGGRLGNRRVGSLAPMTATSFFPAKPLGCYGDGGAVFTDDDDLCERLQSIRQHGRGREKYAIDRVGLNARFDTLQAAVIIAKLEIFEDEIVAREEVAARYTEALADAVETPAVAEDRTSAWAQYTIKTDRRDQLQAALSDAGIPSAVYYPKGMHEQPAYREIVTGTGAYPVAERLCREVISLPMHPYLAPDDQARICAVVRRAMKG